MEEIETNNKYEFGFRFTNLIEPCYIFCKKIEDDLIKELIIEMVCSNKKYAKQLLELVEKRAKELHIDSLSLIAIVDTRLLRWYESIRYICVTEKPYPNSRAKAYSMSKRVT